LPVHNLALSWVWGHLARVTAAQEHAFLEPVWRHCSVYQDIG